MSRACPHYPTQTRSSLSNLQEPDGAWFTFTVFPYAWDVYTLLDTDIFRETLKYESGHRNTSHRTPWKGGDITNKTGTATMPRTPSISAASAPATCMETDFWKVKNRLRRIKSRVDWQGADTLISWNYRSSLLLLLFLSSSPSRTILRPRLDKGTTALSRLAEGAKPKSGRNDKG